MFKKRFMFVMLLVLAVASASAGTWKMHNSYVTNLIKNVFDTGDKVYYVNSNKLYQFDKSTLTTLSLGKQNILSDNTISQIYYDWENKLLFVAYANSNIDVIDQAGKVTNISNIKDIIVRVHSYSLNPETGDLLDYTGKEINDINFANGRAYVATGYGYVCIDEATLKVVHNYDLGRKINSVAVIGDEMLILSKSYCYHGTIEDEDPINNYTKESGSFNGCRMYPINDNSVFILGPSTLYNYEFVNSVPVLTELVAARSNSVQKTPTGFIANFPEQTYYYTFDPTGKVGTKVGSAVGYATSNPDGDGTVWINDANGLHVSGSTAYYKINSLTTDAPFWLRYNGDLNKLYAGSSGPISLINIVATNVPNIINTYDGNNWSNATAYTASGSGYDFVFNPLDPRMYIRAGWKNLYKVVNDQLVTTYNNSNSKLSTRKCHPAFDNYGNMWVVTPFGLPESPVLVLPKDKVFNTTSAKTDWLVPAGFEALNTGKMQRSRFLVSKKNNVKIFSDCDYSGAIAGRIYCWDNGNEDPMVDTYQLSSIGHFVDQNNSQVSWTYLCHFEEDREGMFWVGHDMGLFVFDPDVVFDAAPAAVRPYVTKFSEGQGYLCEGYTVYDIGVDRDNNKWIATNNGVYFVSPDGSEVYNHFTIENSDVPSNLVYTVECDTVHDRVYIYTDNGIAEYIVNGDATSINFDNVYAFPNPIEPDFTGMIKIANLMDNSYVTVTNRDGNIVAQFGPVVGSALWDGSGADGERVPTGIYNIYAAQGAQPAITGTPQTTVMIIK
jgi:hypothetical protein